MVYAVIDTNIIVSSFITKNPSSATRRVINSMLSGKIKPLYNEGKYPLNAVLHISKKYCTFARRHHFSNFETKKRNLALHQHKLMEVIP